MNEPTYVQIDRDSLEFLQIFLFKNLDDYFTAASRRAYLDFNRTLPLNKSNKSDKEKVELWSAGTEMLRENITALLEMRAKTQKAFDDWHYRTCSALRSHYRNNGVQFTYGQAQKWVNMTLKYLYILGAYSFDDIFEFLHPPIDNYILTAATEEFGIPRISVAWSKWDDYKGYLDYQKKLRAKMDGRVPLRWEFGAWAEATQKKG